jgi:hypothetical protein
MICILTNQFSQTEQVNEQIEKHNSIIIRILQGDSSLFTNRLVRFFGRLNYHFNN